MPVCVFNVFWIIVQLECSLCIVLLFAIFELNGITSAVSLSQIDLCVKQPIK